MILPSLVRMRGIGFVSAKGRARPEILPAFQPADTDRQASSPVL
jgi:hypothetical protein